MKSSTVDHGIYLKTAPTEGLARLRHEAQMLSTIRHPGVVLLVADTIDADATDGVVAGEAGLQLARVGGGDLRGRLLPKEEVAGLGAAVATTLADLHDLGVVYGNCLPEHILLGPDGAPVLCSFGTARFGLEASLLAAGRRQDVEGLLSVLSDVSADQRSDVHRLLRRARRQRKLSARSLARLLAGVHGARLPDPAGCSEEGPAQAATSKQTGRMREGRWRLAAAAGAIGLLVTGGALIAISRGSGAAASAAAAGFCPGVDEGCRAVTTPGGILTTPAGQWSISQPGDVVVLGRWSCAGVALPALLQPADGQVWVFDRWAPAGTDVAGRPSARVPGATSLAVLAGRRGCDRLVIIGPGAERRIVDPS